MTKGYEYCLQVLNGEKNVGKYVRLQCKRYKDIVDGNTPHARFDEKRYRRLCALLKLMNQPKGDTAGQSFYETLFPFQWFLLEAIFTIVNDDGIRLYQNLVLEIARKNGKSQMSGIIFVIALLVEPRFSKLYSISVNAQLARETYNSMAEILKSSPLLFDSDVAASGRGKGGKFAITRNYIRCPITDNEYIPLSNNARALDGKQVAFGCVDEVGGLTNNGPIEAIRASQLNLKEKLTICLSTRYPGINNPMEQEIAYCKKVLDDVVDDVHLFALLYEPDEDIKEDWMDNDAVLAQSNPLAVEMPAMWEALVDKRKKAIESEASQAYFLCKNCNIQAADTTEGYVPIDKLRECRVPRGSLNWAGKKVYVGVDLSLVSDNSSVCMVAQDDDGSVMVKPMCFIPADRMEEKTKRERVDYPRYAQTELVRPCGQLTIDYAVVENYVTQIEKKYGVEVAGVYADPWNCQSSAQKWEQNGIPVVMIKQLSYILHEPTSYLEKNILDGKFKYEENPLLEINFENCRCMYDTNEHKYINKKKSNGKIDMVAAMINAVYGLFQDSLVDTSYGAYIV